MIILEEPFTILWNGRSRRVPPGEVVHEVGDALLLFNRTVELVLARSSGQLHLEFRDGPSLDVSTNSSYESWQVVMPDGEQWIGTPGGGVAHLAADRPG